MKCGQAEKWMDAALDERSGGADLLPASWTAQRRTELEAHLAGCPACRAQWQVLCSAEAVLRVPKPVPAPATLLADFRQRLAAEELHEAQRKTPAPRRPGAGWRWLWPLGSLAAAGAAAAVVFMFNIQAPVSSIQEIRDARNRGDELARPQAAAPTPERRKVAAAPSAPSWFKVKPIPGAAPKPEQMAAAPQLTDALRPVTPPAQLSDNFGRQATPPLAYITQPEAEARNLDRMALSQLRQKNVPGAESLVTENKLATTQAALPRPQNFAATKPTLAKEHAEVADKMAAYSRGRVDANEGTQKQLQDVAAASAQSNAAAKQQNFGVNLYANTAQAAPSTDFYYAQVPSEPTPVELNVSAAVLNALQRPVELRTANVRVEDLAQQLALEADVVLKVDPQVARLSVTIDEAGVPLWRVLEDVARQTQMEIYPRDNTLVLRLARPTTLALGFELNKPEAKRSPAEKAKKDRYYFRAPNVAQDAKPAAAPIMVAPPAPAPAPPAPAGVAGPAAPNAGGAFGGSVAQRGARENSQARGLRVTPSVDGTTRYVFAHRQPDRKIWPAAWGNLPERGFEVPTAEELPPLILAPVQVGQSLRNEVPQVRLRRSEAETPVRKKTPAKR